MYSTRFWLKCASFDAHYFVICKQNDFAQKLQWIVLREACAFVAHERHTVTCIHQIAHMISRVCHLISLAVVVVVMFFFVRLRCSVTIHVAVVYFLRAFLQWLL